MPWEKTFDVDETLEKAGQAFWSQGYGATSMQDLLKAMGIQKGSFYNAYGSKHEIYLRALEQYSKARLDDFRGLAEGLDAVEALRTLFEAIYEDCISPAGHRGCMIINCALETAHGDEKARSIVHRSIAAHEGLMRDLVLKGQADGHIDRTVDADATAKTMMALIMGMRVYSRSRGDNASVRMLADQAMALISPGGSML